MDDDSEIERTHLSEKRLGFTLWSEIYISSVSSDVVCIDCGDESNIFNRWLHLDVMNNFLNSPTSVEPFLRQNSPVSYVISCQVDGALEDVTLSYATRFSVTKALRMTSSDDLNWWFNLLQSTSTLKSIGNSADCFLNSRKQPMEAIPKSLSEFKNHRVYVLQSQLGQNACIIPDRKKNFVALFNGEFVYKRSDVSALKSAGSWRKAGRNVIEGQKAFIETMKRLKNGEEVSVKLFGDWQTAKISRPTIIDGILPSNSHGNIEIWGGNENLVPEGTDLLFERLNIVLLFNLYNSVRVFLIKGSILIRRNLRDAVKIAEQFGFQYRKALFGFDEKVGMKFPVIGGIVVFEDDAEIINEALDEIEVIKTSIVAEEKQKEVIKRWRKVVSLILTRNMLRERHGA